MDEPEPPSDLGDFFDSLFKQSRQGQSEDIDDHESSVPFYEVIKDESINLIRIVKHTGENSREVYNPPAKRIVTLRSEQHDIDQGFHIYEIELTDSRYFSTPLVFEAVFDRDGRFIEPEME